MRALVQRVAHARVTVAGREVGAVQRGLLVLLGVEQSDGPTDREWIVRKLPTLRLFPDEQGKMNLSVQDVGGGLLLLSQFTLCADVGKGTRPSFGRAMVPEAARAMFEDVVRDLRLTVPVATGEFGAHMMVELVNDGPVTIWLDSRGRG